MPQGGREPRVHGASAELLPRLSTSPRPAPHLVLAPGIPHHEPKAMQTPHRRDPGGCSQKPGWLQGPEPHCHWPGTSSCPAVALPSLAAAHCLGPLQQSLGRSIREQWFPPRRWPSRAEPSQRSHGITLTWGQALSGEQEAPLARPLCLPLGSTPRVTAGRLLCHHFETLEKQLPGSCRGPWLLPRTLAPCSLPALQVCSLPRLLVQWRSPAPRNPAVHPERGRSVVQWDSPSTRHTHVRREAPIKRSGESMTGACTHTRLCQASSQDLEGTCVQISHLHKDGGEGCVHW